MGAAARRDRTRSASPPCPPRPPLDPGQHLSAVKRSNPAVGRGRTSTSGPKASSRASNARWILPPESSVIGCSGFAGLISKRSIRFRANSRMVARSSRILRERRRLIVSGPGWSTLVPGTQPTCDPLRGNHRRHRHRSWLGRRRWSSGGRISSCRFRPAFAGKDLGQLAAARFHPLRRCRAPPTRRPRARGCRRAGPPRSSCALIPAAGSRPARPPRHGFRRGTAPEPAPRPRTSCRSGDRSG